MVQATMQSYMVGEIETTIEIKAPAQKYYHIPDNLQKCDVLEGEPGKVGRIISWNYVTDGQPKVMKERIEALEPEKNLMVARVIGGDLMKEFKNFFLTIQATPKQRGPGSVVKCHLNIHARKNIGEKVAPHPDTLLQFFEFNIQRDPQSAPSPQV
ncbi:hypothetical protein Bca52824_072494 [Brassica carinata]|uniref:Bet v I/Major latex protein domain-containing protein n=1 Tax=Brassica carinata TaxID=52824 RepID=A0A8X7Q881_BRACI|nr:hypothetical protein Bca52824_072494 [Brassica carinata]